MDLGIGRVFELLRHNGARNFIHQLLGPGDRAAHALFSAGQFQTRAQQRQHLAPLDRHAFGHDQNQLVALGCGHEGQRNAGIATGRLDDGGAFFQQPLGLQSVDHGRADTVLDAGDGIEKFKLGQHRPLGLQLG